MGGGGQILPYYLTPILIVGKEENVLPQINSVFIHFIKDMYLLSVSIFVCNLESYVTRHANQYKL